MNPDIPTPTKLKNGNSKKLSINIKRFGAMITRPRQVFTEINDENHKLADWKSPIIIVGLIIIVAGLLMVTNTTSTSSSQASSSSSGFSLDFSSLATGGMQGGGPMGMGGPNQTNNNAITIDESTATDTNGQATTSSSTLLSRVLSALGGLVSFLLTWLLLGSLINLLAISFGGQANTKMAIVFAAWTCVPLGVRAFDADIVSVCQRFFYQCGRVVGFCAFYYDNRNCFFTKIIIPGRYLPDLANGAAGVRVESDHQIGYQKIHPGSSQHVCTGGAAQVTIGIGNR